MKLMKKAIKDYNLIDCLAATVLALVIGIVPVVGGLFFLGAKEKIKEKKAKAKAN